MTGATEDKNKDLREEVRRRVESPRVQKAIMVLIMIVYLSISLFFSSVLNWYNSKITLVER